MPDASHSSLAFREPELFIIGVMKGGTTILHDYMVTHSQIVGAPHKEVHYFTIHAEQGPEWYRQQFPPRSTDVFALDASPTYFHLAESTGLPGFIKHTQPNAKLILLVRDPVDRAISHFQHKRNVSEKVAFKDIDVTDFFARSLDRAFSRVGFYDYHLHQILSFSLYLRNYLYYESVFGRRNILIVRQDELWADGVAEMRRVFEFCDLEWQLSDSFGVKDYLSGSERLHHPWLRNRLGELLYPNYEKFCERAGLVYREKS